MTVRKDILEKAAKREEQERERHARMYRAVHAEPYSRSSKGPKVKHRERE